MSKNETRKQRRDIDIIGQGPTLASEAAFMRRKHVEVVSRKRQAATMANRWSPTWRGRLGYGCTSREAVKTYEIVLTHQGHMENEELHELLGRTASRA